MQRQPPSYTRGALAAAGVVGLAAALRGSRAPGRAALAAAVFVGPFLGLREALERSGARGPLAGVLAGGMLGWMGALVVAGPIWGAACEGAVVGGVGAGVGEVVFRRLDWERKVWAVGRNERVGWWARWPAWFPVLKEVDGEYEALLAQREVTLAALEEEQERIAELLERLENVRGNKLELGVAAKTSARVRSGSMSDVTDPASPPLSPPSSP